MNTFDDDSEALIVLAKNMLIGWTNIESCPEEMAVLDDILFRMWQMGWLHKIFSR